jgi:hypothetical protein
MCLTKQIEQLCYMKLETNYLNRKIAAAVLALGCMTGFAPKSAYAQMTPIDLSSFYNSGWTSEVNGSVISAAPDNGNAGTGIIFQDWSGQFVQVSGNATTELQFASGLTLAANPVVDALVNTAFGEAGSVNANFTFTNNLGQEAAFSLVGNQTVRDYNESLFTNSLQGFNSDTSLGQVTAMNWWNDGNSGQRLDVQSFVLPSSWSGTNLVNLSINDPNAVGDNILLSAVDVSTLAPLPEPAVGVLVFVGLAAVYVVRKIWRTKRYVDLAV